MVKAGRHLLDLMQNMKAQEAFLSATPFLEVAGDVVLGWMHLWQLSIAKKKLDALF